MMHAIRRSVAVTIMLLTVGAAQAQLEVCNGDITGDGNVDIADLGIVLSDFGCAPPDVCMGDVDGDGDTDITDLAIVLANFGYSCPGDVDCDMDVDITDLGIVLADFNCAPPDICPGDADGDGDTDISDLGIVLANLGLSCVPGDDGVVDLDIDSDNDNGTGLPDRSAAEEDIEENQGSLGKVILVNDDDDDRDGTADNLQGAAIPAEQDDLVPMILEITPPAGELTVNYQLDYNQAPDGIDRVRVWAAATRGVLGMDDIPPGQIEQYTVANGPITLWVEGLAVGTSDQVQIGALADGNGDGQFDAGDIVFASTFQLSASPAMLVAGTPVQWTIVAPAGSPAFDSSTSASWAGTFDPTSGATVGPITVTYDATQTREVTGTLAELVVGDGDFGTLPPIALAQSDGTLEGHQSFDYGGGFTATRATDFSLVAHAGTWELVDFPSDGLGAPALAGVPSALEVLDIATGATPEDAFLANLHDFHYAAVVRIEENATTIANAPASLLVDLIALDAASMEFNRVEVTLFRDDTDGDPAHITYVNDLTVPLTFVDEPLDLLQYSLVIPFHAQVGGSATIVPAGAD